MEEEYTEDKTDLNTEYEQLAAEIYKGLLNAEGFQNINVRHNVKLTGKSGCQHQIDVYWEFTMAEITHKVAIETKNYSKDVSIAKVRDFFGVVHDIGNITGIFATKKGFQKGAKQFADYYGIQLKEIRKPEPDDWKGKLKKVSVSINIMPTKVTSMYVEGDLDWLIAQKIISKKEEAKNFHYNIQGFNEELCVYNEHGDIITNFLELEEQLPHDYQTVTDKKHVFQYENAYLNTDAGRIKIKSIHFTYDIVNFSETMIIDAENIVKAIIKDVKSGKIKFVNNDGTVK